MGQILNDGQFMLEVSGRERNRQEPVYHSKESRTLVYVGVERGSADKYTSEGRFPVYFEGGG